MPREVLLRFLSGIALCGYLGEKENKNKPKTKNKTGDSKKKKRRGRPPKGELPPCPIYYRIIGDKRERDYWMPILKEMMEGKKTKFAADIIYAAYMEGVLDSHPYLEVNASFDVGCRDGYENEIRFLEDGGESIAVNTYREFFRMRREER